MKKTYSTLIGMLALTMSSHSASAADTAVSTMMDEVVVTASRFEESKKDVSANVRVISRNEIMQSAGRSVADLLAEKGLGHIQKYPGALTSIAIRGFRTDTHGNDLQGHVLVLLDGRRAGTGNLAKLLTKNVERIEVIRGPGAVQYGSAGIGGVVNIITRQGKENSFFVEGGGGSFDTYEGSVGATALQNGLDFAGSYTYRRYDDYKTGSGDTYANTSADYETGLSANLGYSFSELGRIGLIFTRFDTEKAGSPGYFSAQDLDDTSDKENYSLDLNYEGKTAGGQYQWLARYFFGEDDNSWTDNTGSDPNGWDTGLTSTNTTDQQGAQIQVSGAFGSTTITTGMDWLDYDVENSWSPNKTSYANPAVFLLGKSSFLGNKLTANIGLRYDWYEVEVEEPVGRDEKQNRLTPKMGLSWLVTQDLKLRAQYAQGFMLPSADQLAADYTNFSGHVLGNPNLDPEKSETYEAGLDYNKNSFRSSLTYFHTDFEDKIETDYLPDTTLSWQNLGEATVAGFELDLSYDIGAPMGWNWEVRPFLGATLLTQYEDETTGEDLQYISGTTLSGGVTVDNGQGGFCRLNVTYTGEQDVQDWESGIYPTPVVELDSFTVADLTAAYRFLESEKYGAFTLRGELRNIFDEEYVYVNGYPMPGRNFFLGLRWDY